VSTNIFVRLRTFVLFSKTYLSQLNLFYKGVQDEQTIRNERRSTRLYLLLFIFSIVILTFYYIIIPDPHTIITESPPFRKYLTLVHHSSLQCPCSKISVEYDQFTQIEPFYHEICQSDFISNDWINHLSTLYEQSWNNSISTDFRRIAVFQFQTIRSLCHLANDLQSFKKKVFIQSELISSEQFQIQINSFIAEFVNSTSKMFLRTLQFVQNTTAQSLLMTGGPMTSVTPRKNFFSGFELASFPFTEIEYTFSDGFTCTCSSSNSTSCMGSATFQNDVVPGFQTGCYMMSALLKSTLQTLYNQSFINIFTNSSKAFRKLNSSLSNWTIEMLLSEMFVDHWLNTTSYERYFNACAPDLCRHTVNQEYGFLRVITLMIGLFGGLSSALKIITPFIIVTLWPVICKLVMRKQTHVTQVEAVENIPSILNNSCTIVYLHLFYSRTHYR
jgi:hypothetical protein